MVSASMFRRPADKVISCLYLIQMFLAAMLDSQGVLPEEWYPKAALEMNRWYKDTYRDPLVSEMPGWFRGATWFEVAVQIPFWAIAAYGYAFNRPWVRLPGLIFSLCSATLMIPIMAELILTDKHFERTAILQMYAPFFVLPLLIAAKTILYDDLHPQAQREKTI